MRRFDYSDLRRWCCSGTGLAWAFEVMSKLKQITCKNRGCKTRFTQFNSIVVWCSPKCGQEIAEAKVKSKYKAETLKMKRDFYANDRKFQIKKTQKIFNEFIRERDKGLPCISCGRHHQGQMQCGHYRTVGANPELRFEPLNCASQCAPCNNHLSGNLIGYRIGLINRIGLQKVEWLEGPHKPKKYSIADLVELQESLKTMMKELKNVNQVA